MARRRLNDFERAIRDARTFEDEDGNRAILIPPPHATAFAGLPHVRAVPGGVLYALDQETLAQVVVETLTALAQGGEPSVTLRRRAVLLRRMTGPALWAEAELAYEMARDVATPGRLQ